jgi:processive 1,2-diacylglycerol beta-glucosyltransferase
MDVKNVVCYSFDLFSQNSLAYLRLIGPLRQLGISIINGIENGQTVSEKILEGNIVVIQRNFSNKFNDYRKIVEIAEQEGKPIVFDMDDLLFSLPENHPYRQTQDYTTSLLPMYQTLRDANLVTVATQKLRDVLGYYNKNVVVLPNYFDDNIWQLKPPVKNKNKNEVLTIGFMGTASHKPDLEYVTPALLDIIRRYPHKILFKFWGIEPPEEIRSFSKVIPIPHVSMEHEYKEFATFFQTQSADIFIAPLVDNLFNKCKSPVKFLEYSALGVPGIFSSLQTYSQVITHGENGLLAASIDDWTECFTQLIENDEMRFQMATNAQSTIRANWLLSQNAFRWQEAFNSLAKGTIHETKATQPDIMQSINAQLDEIFLKKETELQTSMAQIAEQNAQRQALLSEVDEKEQAVQALFSEVDEKEKRVQALSLEVDEKEKRVQALSSQVAQNELTIQALREQLDRTTKDLELSRAEVTGYAQSTSWKITKPIRMIKNIFHYFKR